MQTPRQLGLAALHDSGATRPISATGMDHVAAGSTNRTGHRVHRPDEDADADHTPEYTILNIYCSVDKTIDFGGRFAPVRWSCGRTDCSAGGQLVGLGTPWSRPSLGEPVTDTSRPPAVDAETLTEPSNCLGDPSPTPRRSVDLHSLCSPVRVAMQPTRAARPLVSKCPNDWLQTVSSRLVRLD